MVDLAPAAAPPKAAAALSLRIVEQPARYHRFRYETEIVGGKLGGLLYGRSGGKSCVRLALGGVDPAVHRSVVVIGGTVNPDGYPHPFFMHGDACDSGAFQWKRDILEEDARRGEFEICLEKVSLVCVPQGAEKMQKAIKNREAINFNPFNKKLSEAKYTSKNLRELRLVFQAFYVDKFGTTVPSKTALVQTDIISDIKLQAKLEIEDIHPSQGYLQAKEHVIWVYFKDQLPHSDVSQFSSFLDFDGYPLAECQIRSVKKQLMILSIPHLSPGDIEHQSELLKCNLRINDLKSDVSAECSFMLCSFCCQCGIQLLHDSCAADTPAKRIRSSPAANGRAPSAAEEPIEDLLLSVVNEPKVRSDAFVKPELNS